MHNDVTAFFTHLKLQESRTLHAHFKLQSLRRGGVYAYRLPTDSLRSTRSRGTLILHSVALDSALWSYIIRACSSHSLFKHDTVVIQHAWLHSRRVVQCYNDGLLVSLKLLVHYWITNTYSSTLQCPSNRLYSMTTQLYMTPAFNNCCHVLATYALWPRYSTSPYSTSYIRLYWYIILDIFLPDGMKSKMYARKRIRFLRN